MRIRAVLFDATGVLIEPAEPVGETYARIARRHGVALPAWRLDDAFHRVLHRAPPRVWPGTPAAEAAREERAWWRERVRQTFQAADSTVRFADFDTLFEALYAAFASGDAWRLRAGARPLLETLRGDGRATGVVSNFDHRLEGVLQDLGITPLLDIVMTPARCGGAKPDPAIFHAALAALGDRLGEAVAPGEAVHVGHDPAADAGGAAAAGLLTVLLEPDEPLAVVPTRLERIANLRA